MPMKMEISALPELTTSGAGDLVMVVSNGFARLMPQVQLPTYSVLDDGSGNYFKMGVTTVNGVPTYTAPTAITMQTFSTSIKPTLMDADGNLYNVPIVMTTEGVPTYGQPVKVAAAQTSGLVARIMTDGDGNPYNIGVVVVNGVPTLAAPTLAS